jgi:ankyrin repeat protein
VNGLDELYAGDAAALARRLDADPALVHAREPSAEGPYCGYFYRATLLHHVAGNPTIRPLPPNIVEIARLLLDRGAEVDAVTEQGPSQPDDIGWTTLGLAATSGNPHAIPLVELMLERGADLDARNGGPLIGALYYDQLDAARHLVERGARVDMVAAAGLGRIDLMEAHAGEYTLVHYSQHRARPSSPDAIALVYACKLGHLDAARWLLDRGAPLGRAPYDHDATPLHWAAHENHPDVCELLLARGADRTVRDTSFDGTPADWAAHAGHHALAEKVR